MDTLRIFVFVPQTYAFDVRVGQSADITLREQPDRVFKGIVTRTAGAIDPASRTLLTEVDVPNRDGALLSGSYVTVHFKIQRSEPPLLIPGPALLVGSQGTRVAVVGSDDILHYRPVDDRPGLRRPRRGPRRPRGVRRHRHGPARRHRRRREGTAQAGAGCGPARRGAAAAKHPSSRACRSPAALSPTGR